MENEKSKKATQEGVDKAAYAYATERQQDPNYPTYNWEEEITDAWKDGYHTAVDKACTNLRFFFKAIDEDYDCNKFIDWFRKEMEEQQ